MKFKIGETVYYRPVNHRRAAPGAYEVTRLLPRPENAEPVYRIKNLNDCQERDAKESELKALRRKR